MLNVYKVMSENVSSAIGSNGEGVTKQPLIKSMRTVKRETLRLISSWVKSSNDPQMVSENFVPPLLEAVLLDYQRNVPEAREPEVLSTMATIVNKLEVRWCCRNKRYLVVFFVYKKFKFFRVTSRATFLKSSMQCLRVRLT